jgi:hypothetical protein
MQAFRIAPPLPAQILMAIFRRLADRKPYIVQFDVRIAATAADIEHEQLHLVYRPRFTRSAVVDLSRK